MDVRYANSLTDGQLNNTGGSLLEAEGCQLWGMRGHVLLRKWSGVRLSARKEVPNNFEKPGAQQPQACLLPLMHFPIQAAKASLRFNTAGVLLQKTLIGTKYLQLWRC